MKETKNKYQEALDNLKEPTDAWSSAQLQMAENFEEPIVYEYQEDINTLQELVDKATPKKPDILGTVREDDKEFQRYKCPNCGLTMVANFYNKYCPYCGQELDWSDEDE